MKINLRAWDKKNKEMITVGVFTDGFGCYSFYEDEDGGSDLQWFGGYEKDWIPLFSSGLKDKNGSEIYEGDIVKQTFPGARTISIADVIYSRGRFCLNNGTIPDDLIPEACEVIGNIYENPELIIIKNEDFDLDRFKKNPILIDNHCQGDPYWDGVERGRMGERRRLVNRVKNTNVIKGGVIGGKERKLFEFFRNAIIEILMKP